MQMSRSIDLKAPLAAIALAAIPLAGCATDGYGYGYGNGYYGGDYGDRYAYSDGYYGSPYDVWYDGYYGPIDSGYWGGDGYFYYTTGNSRDWRRGETGPFRREAYGNYRHYQFPRRDRDRYADERRYGQDRDRDRDRDRNYDRSDRRGYR
jgi:hypothetical protein